MAANPSTESIPASAKFAVAIMVATPFLLIQLLFLSNYDDLNYWLPGYGEIFLIAPVVFLCLFIFCIVEYLLRRKQNLRPAPSFGIAASIMLLAFFLQAIILNPVLINFPLFCRSRQTIEWSTSVPREDSDLNHEFHLVLIAEGNQNHHRFISGYMNWTGECSAGFTSVQFRPISIQEHSNQNYIPGDPEYLKSLMTTPDLPDEEVDTIATDAWNVLNQADKEQEIHPEYGIVNKIYCDVDEQWCFLVGGWIWRATLILLFMLVGWFTIRYVPQKDDTDVKSETEQ